MSAACTSAAHSTLGIIRATKLGLNSTGLMRTSVACGEERFTNVGPGPGVSILSGKRSCKYLQAQRETTRAHAPHMGAQEVVSEQFHVATLGRARPEPEGVRTFCHFRC